MHSAGSDLDLDKCADGRVLQGQIRRAGGGADRGAMDGDVVAIGIVRCGHIDDRRSLGDLRDEAVKKDAR